MASCGGGYKCTFIASVRKDFYCRECSLVAREPTLTTCCTETYCQDCVTGLQKKSKACPACGEEGFATIKAVKYLREIRTLLVYCSMKERGCVWSGTLDQLDTHLDPHLDNCQYVDTKCPLNCLQTIPKNKVDQHVAQECTKRPHVCQHCGFKATYEEMVNTHLPECKYVALQCPNMCGVCCEREVMDHHMEICRLEKIKCRMGCTESFAREDQDEHDSCNVQKHIFLTASANVELKQKVHELELSLKKCEFEFQQIEQELGLGQKQVQLAMQMLQNHDKKFEHLELQLKKLQHDNEEQESQLRFKNEQIERLQRFTGCKRTFTVKNFSGVKDKGWKSKSTYVRLGGCKFSIIIAIEISGDARFYVSLQEGVFDKELQWPHYMCFTFEIVNQNGGSNLKEVFVDNVQHTVLYKVSSIDNSRMSDFLHRDMLTFTIYK